MLGVKIKICVNIPYTNNWYKTIDFLKDRVGKYKIYFSEDGINLVGEVDVETYKSIKEFILKNGGEINEEESIDIEAIP